MKQIEFLKLFSDLYIPVIVCRNTERLPVEYVNIRAGMLFFPMQAIQNMTSEIPLTNFEDIVKLQSQEYNAIYEVITKIGNLNDYKVKLTTFEGKTKSHSISSSLIEDGDSGCEYIIFYLNESIVENEDDLKNNENTLTSIIRASLLTEDVDKSIQMILGLLGEKLNMSRAYIFEDISDTTTRNTYEWCAKGIKPVIQELQNLRKEDYNYELIVNSGMYITEDVSKLPGPNREILERQGIKSLAIIPFYDSNKVLGYIGFDDCEKCRRWSLSEIEFLQNSSFLIATLIKRRNAEQKANMSQNILRIISDNSDDMIYVNDLVDYKLKFVSKYLADALDKSPEQLIGECCWKVLQKDQTGPCDFCPMPKIEIEEGKDRSETYQWENRNFLTGKTYFIKDNIIKWADGQYVHIETAIDISKRKDYEEQLQYYASTDVMTDVYNREWGNKILARKLGDSDEQGSLCFLDLDGLKNTNDRYGHDAGDRLIIETINIVKKHIRGEDFICRWGGDEFILWLRTNVENSENVISRIKKDMDEYNKNRTDKTFTLSFSYGIVPFIPGAKASLDTLITVADELMYKNKMQKRNKNKREADEV